MKFLFRSSDGLCLPQALRVKSEGNQVKLDIVDKAFDNVGNGLIDKTISFDRDVEWADVVVYCIKDEKLANEADETRKRKPTVGASKLGGMLEHDRKFGIDFARAHGVKCPEVEEFSGRAAFAKAREYLQSKPRLTDWVLKANGQHPEGVRSFVSQDGRVGALRMLGYWEDLYEKANLKPDFVISTKVSGVEISTEAWFNGKEFSLPNHTIERNRFFPGDLGEKVGCAGNVVWQASPDSPLVTRLLQPLAADLAGQFVGPLDVNAIIEKSSGEPVFLEYSPRFGYDAIFALMELFESDFGQFLHEIATGQTPTFELYEGFAGSVRLSIPPFPAVSSKDDDAEAVGVPIFGVDPSKYNPHFHWMEAMLDKDDKPVTSGPHGVVVSVSGRGETCRDAEQAAYDEIDKIRIPAMRYRNDLVEAIGDVYDDLEATGILEASKPQAKSLLTILASRR